MPSVRIDVPEKQAGRLRQRDRRRRDAAAARHDAHAAAERFQVVTVHPPAGLSIDPDRLGIDRPADAVIMRVFLDAGRDAATEWRFCAALAEGPHEAVGLRREDLVISLAEVQPEDWSFGNGEVQLAR